MAKPVLQLLENSNSLTSAPSGSHSSSLKKTLGPISLWGLGVGYVISGMYFGWNLGLPEGGPFGLLAATLLVTVMYVTFVLSYAELSCAIPRAGGAFAYTNRAFGPRLGFLGGVSQCIEFVFAPPAIAAAIGAYFHLFLPGVPALTIGAGAYLLFTALNIYGVRQSAAFELFITVIAVFELLLFAGIAVPHFTWTAFAQNPLPHGWSGIFPAIPYAIWFYLAIEGIANVAEETKNPQKDLARGFGSAMITLIILALVTFFSSVGIQGWEAVVYAPGTTAPSDSPLPMALGHVVGTGTVYYHLLITIGVCGLLASFHGIILVAGRATLEFGRIGYAPKILGTTLETRQTPAAALLLNMGVGMIALFTGKTAEIITISVFGALTMYVISLLALFKLRKSEPELVRPFKTPLYPWVPTLSLLLAVLSLVAMTVYNFRLAVIYVGMLGVAYAWFFIAVRAVRGVREVRSTPPLSAMTLANSTSSTSALQTVTHPPLQERG
ncbi:MAG: ethanolamine permease [Methylotenera sp.]|nr:ethanolamine permease [Oligoflexia bacterium]